MILYHSSFTIIDKPSITYSRKNADLGDGFYVEPIYEQACKWVERFTRNQQPGFISEYEFNSTLLSKLNVMEFSSFSESWLDFIMHCRKGKNLYSYDIVIGAVVNDDIFDTIELYDSAIIDKFEALKRLKNKKPDLQICFRTQEALSHLKFIRSNKL